MVDPRQYKLIQTLTDLNGLWLINIHITFTNMVYFALNFHQNIVNLICERGVVSYWSAATAARPLWEIVAYIVFTAIGRDKAFRISKGPLYAQTCRNFSQYSSIYLQLKTQGKLPSWMI